MTVRNASWRIDAGTGWRTGARTNVFVDAQNALTVRPLTGRAAPLQLSSDVAGPGLCPSAMAGDCRGRLLVLDAATAAIARVGPRCEAVWPSVGGVGSALRRFRAPRGMAVLPSGALAIADTGNHRIQIFAPTTTALLQVVGGTNRLGRPLAGTGAQQFNRPWDVAADRRGRLYVADRGNARIVRLDAGGSWLGVFGAGFLRDPVRVAVGSAGAIAVVDAASRRVLLFTPDRTLPRTLPVDDAASVAFGSEGTLFVGDGGGAIHTFASAAGSSRYERVGTSPTGLPRAILALATYGERERLALIVDGETSDTPDPDATDEDVLGTLWTVEPTGGFAPTGAFESERIDSRRERHQWQRVSVEGDVPSGTTVLIESATSDDESPDERIWTKCLLATASNPDCLVQSGPGRFLWLRLTLGTNGRQTPAVTSIDVSLDQSSYLQYLPGILQEDEESRRFLGRFLAIFQSGFDELNGLVEQLASLFDPHRTRADHLAWLAGWLGLLVDPGWTEAQLRQEIAGAVQGYTRRGTPDGVQAAIRAYAGVETRIVEHFRLRQLARLSVTASLDGSAALWSPDRTERLQLGSHSQLGLVRLVSRPEPATEALDWGANRFTVLFDADPYEVTEIAERVAKVVAREKPAHTDATICPVFPRMRVGIQARLGVDASVGEISYTVLNRLATLNYDTVLGCSDHEQSLTAYGTARSPRVGDTTRLA